MVNLPLDQRNINEKIWAICILREHKIRMGKEKKKKEEESLNNIEFELARLEDPHSGGYDSL